MPDEPLTPAITEDSDPLIEQARRAIFGDIVRNLKMAGSFLSAEASWLLHGRPYRDTQDINHLYYHHCTPCEFFENDGCKICNCRIVPNERGPLNKLSMATTNCPIPNAPKWISAITPPGTLNPTLFASLLADSKADLTETTDPTPFPDAPVLSEATLQTIDQVKKKVAAATAADAPVRTRTGQYIQGDQS